MKRILIILTVLAIGLYGGWWLNEFYRLSNGVIADMNNPDLRLTKERINLKEAEDFDQFFFRFMYDSLFQVSRTIFPLTFIHFEGEPGTEIDTTLLDLTEWRHSTFYLNESSIPIIYDNFEKELNDSNERVFMWAGVENGIHIAYYFQRTNGEWRMIKLEDLST